MEFVFKNPLTGEKKTVELNDHMIRLQMEDVAHEILSDCNCEPTGETNVTECSCAEYYDDFEMVAGA